MSTHAIPPSSVYPVNAADPIDPRQFAHRDGDVSWFELTVKVAAYVTGTVFTYASYVTFGPAGGFIAGMVSLASIMALHALFDGCDTLVLGPLRIMNYLFKSLADAAASRPTPNTLYMNDSRNSRQPATTVYVSDTRNSSQPATTILRDPATGAITNNVTVGNRAILTAPAVPPTSTYVPASAPPAPVTTGPAITAVRTSSGQTTNVAAGGGVHISAPASVPFSSSNSTITPVRNSSNQTTYNTAVGSQAHYPTSTPAAPTAPTTVIRKEDGTTTTNIVRDPNRGKR